MSALQLPATLPRSSIDPQFDKFLYAQIGEESNGMQLSVLSALARQNVDPWEIAQQLTSLPREPAIRFLTPLLARIPASASARAAPEDIAARLVALLHSPLASAEKPGISRVGQESAQPVPLIFRIQLIVALTLFMLFTQLLIAGWTTKAISDKPAAPGVSAPSAVKDAKASGQQ